MSVLYVLLTLLCAGTLLLFLARPGLARPLVVWGLAALLPLLAALASALGTQARAARVLAAGNLSAAQVSVTTGARTQTLTLSAQDAACLERALRLRSTVTLDTPGGPVTVRPGTRVQGTLPSRQVVEALTLRGELHCPALRTLSAPER
ncbi:hypothetical protein [Deinococcus koreensis]|uniref:Uncharacterized protein n=1 Tax=Deinococcus koreensis TaxID=2054903 RepID=A0A2K3UZ64_9DEIO|nr:hypothetical protein [Deinococcus koreensis]PNY81824.1 hypothetical protein CVO96_10950 [Deinococcus koreensis]